MAAGRSSSLRVGAGPRRRGPPRLGVPDDPPRAEETRESWKPPYGERSEYPDRYNALTVELREAVAPARTLVVEFRAYDEGVAFRYHVPAQAGLESFVIGDEVTEFRLPAGVRLGDASRADAYERVAVERMTQPPSGLFSWSCRRSLGGHR